MRKCGRLGDTQYPDPDAQGTNPCLTDDTWIMTEDGPRMIKDLVDKEKQVYVNGKKYSTTKQGFFYTGTQQVFEIQTQEGFSIKGTDNHQILTTTGWKQINELKVKDKIVMNNHGQLNWDGNGTESDGYLLGQLLGNGTLMEKTAKLGVWEKECQEKVMAYIEKHMSKLATRSDFKGWYHVKRNGEETIEYRIQNVGLKNLANQFGMYHGSKIITDKIEMASSNFYIGFLRGLFDTDGSPQGTIEKGFSIRLSQANLSTLQKAQRMLLRLGIYSKIYKERQQEGMKLLPDGKGGKKEYMCQKMHELYISQDSIVKFQDRIGFFHSDKNDRVREYLRNIRRGPYKQKYVSTVSNIIELDIQKVYDCTVPKINAFDANGMYVHNCSEIVLSDGETCCLSELYLPNISTKEELFKCATYMYKVCKHSLTLPCQISEKTERVVHQNMRIGIGVTGYLQSTDEQKSWLAPCYEYLRDLDTKYSIQHGFPRSIRLTTVKPSGTLSLLGNVTPGVHPGFAQYYIRRVRIASESPLIKIAKEYGYPVEYVKNFDGSFDHTTQIVSFPMCLPEGTVLAKDCSAVRQLEYVKELQAIWSDNCVSVSIYYRKEELSAIKDWLRNNYNNSIKSVSFILHSGHNFEQAPMEEITKEQYEEMSSQCRPISSTEGICYVSNDEKYMGEGECKSNMCPVR